MHCRNMNYLFSASRIQNKQFFLGQSRMLLMAIAFIVVVTACGTKRSNQYVETFDTQGKWGIGNSEDVEGLVDNGVYGMFVKDNYGIYRATAGERFSNGVFEVEATQMSGPINNGFGMLFHLDNSNESFYVFEVSGDGFVWIGYCSDLCNGEMAPLVGGGWFRSRAVNRGLLETNRLKVVSDGPRMNFFVNGVEVGRTSDDRLKDGDIAVMVETLGQDDVRVAFDNFIVTPPG